MPPTINSISDSTDAFPVNDDDDDGLGGGDAVVVISF
jgi:hypothetical protein